MTSHKEYKFLPVPQNAPSLSPKEARDHFRVNNYYGSTSGFCLGHIQANVTVMAEQDADSFEEFCKRNSAALPLLYKSLPGELGAPPLAADTNIRTDLPRYLIFSHGRQVNDMKDLCGFDWKGRVSFYIGCTYSFEKSLMESGVPLRYAEGNKLVSVYLTNIDCFDVGKFAGVKMVVSMRPVKEEHLQTTVAVTSCYPVSGHGAPIHIGDPRKIGLPLDLSTSFDMLREMADIKDDEIPVFWACGVTGKQAVEALGADLSFTHYPGSMFITDLDTDSMKQEPTSEEDKPCVVRVSPTRQPYWASLATQRVINQLRKLEESILDDPGECGVRKLRVEEDFIKSVFTLSHAQSVAIIFGFPCNTSFENPEETDGPPGALSIAQSLVTLGKRVALVSEERNRELVEKCVDYLASSGALKSRITFLSCTELLQTNKNEYDCVLAIERVGEAKDGGHYTSRGMDVTSYLEPAVDSIYSSSSSSITIGIGDRGNELGLGKIYDKVSEVMRNGDKLGCTASADHVIMAGVSNWGGYALSVGLYLLTTCPVHWRYLVHGVNASEEREWSLEQFLPTNEQTKGLLTLLNQLGVRDGISKAIDQSVDGLPLDVHLEKLNELRSAAK